MLTAIWFFHRYVLFALAITYMLFGVVSRLAYALRRRPGAPPATPPQEVLPTS
jgi:hypothetical protein